MERTVDFQYSDMIATDGGRGKDCGAIRVLECADFELERLMRLKTKVVCALCDSYPALGIDDIDAPPPLHCGVRHLEAGSYTVVDLTTCQHV